MARTQNLGELAAPAALEGRLKQSLQWSVSPLDGPQIVLVVLVVVCGLLGLAWRGRHRPPGA
ncbi:hypothetical protein [Nannocystis punicea]|uniref:Uncharacterized protein n=1 Tax=Nannocystis punicea TaxID=2995304 RepID=A0ABY7H4X2_9BACT|nr:hypothetical protein [Nannocystis poenicansa]WAS94333.1 hypothetical protein O0S08_50070 [Nannocystis poenicansa]